ncbi:MAG: glycosyltransferase, partial [Sphingomonadales bacterium]|nr:glycosyltransferase [Sphingomonadales bacterium]
MTIILISNSRGTLVNDLYAHLLGKGKNVKLAYIIPKQKSFWNKYRLLRGLYFLGCLLGLLRFYKADIFHVHYISPNIVRTLSILKFMCRKLIWTLWGSDFRVTSNRSLHIRNAERIKSKVDVITSTSNAMAKDYKGALGVDDVKVIRFGLSVFQTIDAIQKP